MNTIIERIIQFNEKRKLLKPVNWSKEFSFIAEELSEGLRANTDIDRVDALADMIVFAVGAMKKAGYDPTIIMEEVLKHIESDTGYYDEAQQKWIKTERSYQTDFTKAQ